MRADQPLNIEVAVLTETGDIGMLTHWARRRDDAGETTWRGHVTVYRGYDQGGAYRATLPAERIVPLIYCGRLPTGEIRHRCDRESVIAAEQKAET